MAFSNINILAVCANCPVILIHIFCCLPKKSIYSASGCSIKEYFLSITHYTSFIGSLKLSLKPYRSRDFKNYSHP